MATVRGGNGSERRVTGITGQPLEYANTVGKIPPSVLFGPDGHTLYFTEFEHDILVRLDNAGLRCVDRKRLSAQHRLAGTA